MFIFSAHKYFHKKMAAAKALLDKNENNMHFIALTVQGRLVFNSHCYPNCHHRGDIDCYPICEAEAISKGYCSKQRIQDTETH